MSVIEFSDDPLEPSSDEHAERVFIFLLIPWSTSGDVLLVLLFHESTERIQSTTAASSITWFLNRMNEFTNVVCNLQDHIQTGMCIHQFALIFFSQMSPNFLHCVFIAFGPNPPIGLIIKKTLLCHTSEHQGK